MSFYSKDSALRPWKYNLLGQRDLALTPSNPGEFYDQLTVAFEKWKKVQSGIAGPQNNRSYWQISRTSFETSHAPFRDEKPLLRVQPVFKTLAAVSTFNALWYMSGIIFPLIVVLMFASGGHKELPGNYFLICWDLFLISMLVIALLSPVFGRKRMPDKYRYEFFSDRMKLGIAGDDAATRIISYADIISIELVNKRAHRIFNIGGVLIRTSTVTLINEATRLAETVLIIPDVPDAGKTVGKIHELIEAYKRKDKG